MTYDDALERITNGGRMVRASRLAHGVWTELHLSDPMQERADSDGPFLFASLSNGDLVRWQPSDDDRAADDWMAE